MESCFARFDEHSAEEAVLTGFASVYDRQKGGFLQAFPTCCV